MLADNYFKVLESQFYIDLINNKYPLLGSRIDFKQYSHLNTDNFINNIIIDNYLDIGQEIIYIRDGVTECAFK